MRYRNFLKNEALIHLKTDSRFLHEYTKALLIENELNVNEANTDIYKDNNYNINHELEIKTHYEKQYLAQQLPITYLQFSISGNKAIKEPAAFDPELF
jgi:tRNA (guanine-N7-)-methyltransferase